MSAVSLGRQAGADVIQYALGGYAQLAMIATTGLLVVSGALAISRGDADSGLAQPLFWVGLLLIVCPFAVRLAEEHVSRSERLASVVTVGMLLFFVKVVHDPTLYTYADEWVHTYNAQEILRTGHLYQPNPIISVTPRYPGLEVVTAAVASLTGLGVFASGLVVLGASRLVMMIALFLLFERVTRSARVAALGVLVYAANPNFLFWSAQFSYESLALPLVAVALLAVAMRMPVLDGEAAVPASVRRSWLVVGLAAAAGVIVTHHLSSYALLIALAAVCVVAALRRRPTTAPLSLLVLVAAGAAAWLGLVAPGTWNYLEPVLVRAFHETIDTITTGGGGRTPFSGSGGGSEQNAAIWQRLFAFASVLIVVAVLPFGLRHVWRRERTNTLLLVLATAAGVYIAVLPMRLVPAAWETSNRASEFLYLGIAVVLVVAIARRAVTRRFLAISALSLGVMLIGGVVAGWPPRAILAHPYAVRASGATLYPEEESAARWARGLLGDARRWIAPEAVGRVLLVRGDQFVYVTSAPFNASTVLHADRVTAGIVRTLEERRVTYVVIDRRETGDDSMTGFFFQPRTRSRLIPREVAGKFDDYPGVDRIYDSGNIVVYDVRRLWSGPVA